MANEIRNKLKELFPLELKDYRLPEYLAHCKGVLEAFILNPDAARVIEPIKKVSQSKGDYILKKYSNLPLTCNSPIEICKQITEDFFAGIPRWRSPQLHHNVGAPVNTAGLTLYTLALDENVYNINEDLAGNVLLAEAVVSKILAELADIPKRGVGLFTFGGTATNIYATKIGIKKGFPESGRKGIPDNIRVMVTEDSHFSHTVSADWLGIGTDRVIVVAARSDRSTDINDAEEKLRKEFKAGNYVTSIIINGGTTYGHVIDDINAFADLRNRMVIDYNLPYRPHLHVDSVIGWAWLMFNGYDFEKNELGIENRALNAIKYQFEKIAAIKNADSWGVDFHKGVGTCPVNCSIVMINDARDLNLISKKKGSNIEMHQLANEFCLNSPADFTLETSRSGGPALAALATLHVIGQQGFREHLANLVEQSLNLKSRFALYDDVTVCHQDTAFGYVTMVRFYPPELKNDPLRNHEFQGSNKNIRGYVKYVNQYMKEFFKWDRGTRIKKSDGVEYSFSSGYMEIAKDLKLSGAKFYPVSPYLSRSYIESAVAMVMKQKKIFDKKVWKKN